MAQQIKSKAISIMIDKLDQKSVRNCYFDTFKKAKKDVYMTKFKVCKMLQKLIIA